MVGLRFKVLGPLEVIAADRRVPLTGKPLVLLATLLVRANTAVSTEALAQALWEDEAEAPVRVKGTVQTYVMRLRRALGPDVIRTTPAGYRIDADAGCLDLLHFRELADAGDAAAAAGDDTSAGKLFEAALQLWRGPVLQDVDSVVLQREDVPALAERRLQAWEGWVDAQLRSGRLPLPELQRLTTEYPLHERFWEQLLLALARAGRSGDALAAYHRVSALLADELGLDPSPSLQQVRQAILIGDTAGEAPAEPHLVPRQLSAAVDGFTGREDELAQLGKLLTGGDGSAAVVAAIEGTGGVGKSALALRFAHAVSDEFPAGQLQMNLQGYGPGEPVSPAAALGSLLQSVGVAAEQVPATLDARAALWRSRTARHRMLILLDNARNSEQVRPLLPATGCLVIVTSRSQLSGLAARDGAVRIPLGRLPECDALDLLVRTVGGQRVRADEAASRRFVERCARLPLAIRILGQHANQQPDRPLAAVLDEMATPPLASFDLGDGADTNLREIFAQSYSALDGESARLFRLLGRHPGRAFDAPAAAALAGLDVGTTRRLLDRLVRAYLVEQPRAGRYELHDLLREFAHEQTGPDDAAATVRVLDWYVYAALRVSQTLRPGWIDKGSPPPSFQLPDLPDYVDALRWYADHHGALVAAAVHAHGLGLHRHVCQLALTLRLYFTDFPVRDGWHARHEVTVEVAFDDVPVRDSWITTHELALDSARVLGDRAVEGRVLNGLCVANSRFGNGAAAIDCGRAALAIARECGSVEDEFSALNNLGVAHERLSAPEAALPLTEAALDAATRLGAARTRLLAMNNLASVYVALKRFDEALVRSREAAALLGDGVEFPVHDRAYTMLTLAAAEAGTGDRTAALAAYRTALALSTLAGDRLAQGEIHEQIGDLYAAAGEDDAARMSHQRALDLLVALGHPGAARVNAKLGGQH